MTVIIIAAFHLTHVMCLVLSLYFTKFSLLILTIFLEAGYDFLYFTKEKTGAKKDYLILLRLPN